MRWFPNRASRAVRRFHTSFLRNTAPNPRQTSCCGATCGPDPESPRRKPPRIAADISGTPTPAPRRYSPTQQAAEAYSARRSLLLLETLHERPISGSGSVDLVIYAAQLSQSFFSCLANSVEGRAIERIDISSLHEILQRLLVRLIKRNKLQRVFRLRQQRRLSSGNFLRTNSMTAM